MLEGRLREALAFNAPFVIDKLVKDRIAATPALAEQLFAEAKKYLVLCAATPDATYGMYSAMVDEAWHAFVLFTAEYTEYSHSFFGHYFHHAPATDDVGSGPMAADDQALRHPASFDAFRRRYEELYGQPLPAVWYDDTSVAPSRRVINDKAGTLTVILDDQIVRLVDAGEAVLSVNDLAAEAVHFIAQTTDFYVREVPGDLTGEEQVGVIAPLVRLGVLRLAP